MKIKKILSMIVVLSMILAVVPVFGITASAYTIDTSLPSDATLVFNGGLYGDTPFDDSTFKDDTLPQDNASPWNKFTVTADTNFYTNLKKYDSSTAVKDSSGTQLQEVFFQIYTNGGYSGGGTSMLTTADNAFAKNSEYFAVQFFFNRVNADNITDIGLFDADGKFISAFEFHKENNKISWLAANRESANVGGTAGTLVSGADSFGTPQAYWYTIFVRNYPSENKYTVTYAQSGQNTDYREASVANNWTEIITLEYPGQVNGFSGFKSYIVKSNGWNHIRFGGLRIYAGPEITNSTAGSVASALSSLTLPLGTRTDIELPATATDSFNTTVDVTWTSDKPEVLSNTGVVTSPETITDVVMTPKATYDGTTVEGTAKTVKVFPASRAGTTYSTGTAFYDIGTTNLITNGSFEDASGNFTTSDWTSHLGNFQTEWWNVTESGVIDNSGNSRTPNNYTGGDAVPLGKSALGSMWSDDIATNNYCTIDTMWPVEAGKTYYFSFYGKRYSKPSTDETPQVYAYFTTDNSHHSAAPTGEQVNQITLDYNWAKYEYMFTAAEAGYVGFTAYKLGGSVWPSSHSLGSAFDDFELYEATQQAETLQDISVDITVIQGNTPLYPTTVVGKGSKGSDITATLNWTDTSAVNKDVAGTYDITGTATAGDTTVNATGKVKVLSQSFTLNDMTQATGTQKFPMSLEKEFSIEFDFNSANLDNNWIYISKDGALWGGGQVGIGTSADQQGILKFQPEADASTIKISANTTYRILATIDPVTSTYDAIMTGPDGNVVKTVTDYSFRTASTQINSVVTTNNGSNGGVGTFTLSNIKVHSTEAESALTQYTVSFTASDSFLKIKEEDKSKIETKTVSAVQDTIDKMPANPYLPGYVPPEISGYVLVSYSLDTTAKTFTLNYEPHKESTGTWFTRNNVQGGDMLIADMNMLGAHDAFTCNMSKVPDAAACIGGDSGSKQALYGTERSAILGGVKYYVESSQTQNATPAEMLRAGVRYFDVRLSVSDDVEYDVPKTGGTSASAKGTNGELYTTHAYLAQPFRTVLWEIRDICRENPGEVIILDFQEIYNSVSDLNSSWEMAASLLKEIIGDYLVSGYETAGSITYDKATEGGTRAGVICIGKPGSQNYQSSVFLAGGDRNGAGSDTSGEDGYNQEEKSNIYSFYSTAATSYDDMKNTIKGDQIKYVPADITTHKRFMVMQAIYGVGEVNLITNGTDVSNNLIDEADFPTWMKTLKIVMTDASTIRSDDYVDMFAEFNRDTYESNYSNTVNGVTMATKPGEGKVVPLSTKLNVAAADASGTAAVSDKSYNLAKSYGLSLVRYADQDASIAENSTVYLTFPGASTDAATDNVLLRSTDGGSTYTVLAQSSYGTDLTAEVNSISNGTFYVATIEADNAVEVTVKYVDESGNVLKTLAASKYVQGADVVSTAASTAYYFEGDNNAYIVSSAAKTYTTADADANGILNVTLTVVHKYAVWRDTFANNDGDNCDNTENNVMLGAADGTDGVNKAPAKDADKADTYSAGGYYGSTRAGLMEFIIDSELSGKAVYLNLYVDRFKTNGDAGTARIAAYTVANSTDELENNTKKYNDAAFTATSDPMFSVETVYGAGGGTNVGATDVKQWVSIDVTEAVQKALDSGESKITFKLLSPIGGIYVADRENAEIGGGSHGSFEGLAAYLQGYEGETVTVNNVSKITKNGSSVSGLTTTIRKAVAATETTAEVTPGSVKAYLTDGTAAATVYNTADGSAVATPVTAGGTYEYIAAVAGPTAYLGWNGTDLTIDFVFGEALADGYQVAVTRDDGALVGTVTAAELTANNNVISLETADSNAIYTAAVQKILDGNIAATVGSTREGLYSAVVKNLINVNYAGMSMSAARIAMANEVITKGGVVDSASDFAEIGGKILKVDNDTAAGTTTVTVKNPYDTYGIGFVLYGKTLTIGSCTNASAANATANTVYTSFSVNTADGTITLISTKDGAVQDVEVFSLESVDLAFVEELINEESVSDEISVDMGSFDMVM